MTADILEWGMPMKKMRLAWIAVAAVTIVSCGTDAEPGDAIEPAIPSESSPVTEAPDPQDDRDLEGEADSGFEFVPSVPVPQGLPVYPGAELWNDLPSGSDWQWLYQTTGSGNEIVAFFSAELEGLGFEIDPGSTTAFREEFFVATTDGVVAVYWLAADEDGVDEDTPDRGYGIVVDVEAWNAR